MSLVGQQRVERVDAMEDIVENVETTQKRRERRQESEANPRNGVHAGYVRSSDCTATGRNQLVRCTAPRNQKHGIAAVLRMPSGRILG